MIKFLYKNILKPILFKIEADYVHVFFLHASSFIGRFKFLRFITKKIFLYKNEYLNTKILGLKITNPLGLAAGFDYNADLLNVAENVGFGFQTVGTITNLPYEGNKKPMLGRLPRSKSLLVNKGFKNNGIDFILDKVSKKKNNIPVGISIGTTNKSYCDIKEMIEDVTNSFRKVVDSHLFDFYELNISCPNLSNITSVDSAFDTKEGFTLLLNKLSTLAIRKPLFIKMYLEKNVEETLLLVEIASSYNFVTGFIFANLVKDRSNIFFDKDEITNAGKGNFSGKPTEEMSNNLISEVYKKYKNRFVIIGCGGVFSGFDAYEKIKRGASLVQMITGMIYEGPTVMGDINKDLVKLLKKDGYKSIGEAVGSYYK
ncbi:TPA: dihydroorotate dehydrogenase (quinone) [Candidatus Nomurabacteria bacterium]|nr:MAG: dihydroorotate dehydrogenase 2, nonfunctional [Parcubacteria bacterium RAAC4_OD1_1]HCY26345.1 dihydroorotate dehydrogenase (quinone) [Candidatus Nomurabacteria bacterium]